MFVVMALTQVLGVSAVAMISQAVGRKQQGHANLVFNQSLVLAGLCSVITLVCGYAFADSYMLGLSSDSATQLEGQRFLHWFIPGMALQFVMMGMASALRGTGIVKPGMVVQVVTVILNTILAPVLIVGMLGAPALGVVGAGLASSISVFAGILMLAFYFIKLEKYVRFNPKQWKPDFKVWKEMLVIGLPAGGEMLLMFGYFAMIYWVIQDFGATAQAGFSIGGRIMQSIFMPTMAIAFAIGPIAGQNFGALHPQRVVETRNKGVLLNTLVMLVVTILIHISPGAMVRVFTNDAAVIEVGSVFLQIVSINFIAQGIVFSCSGMFQGLGNTRPAMLSSGFRLLIFIPIAIYLRYQPGFEIRQLWYVSVLAVTLQAALSYWLLARELDIKLRPISEKQSAVPEPQTEAG
jgi:putative MATE family efflux protein